MSKLKSIFGTYADKLQILVDKSADLFAPTWFDKYFTMGTPTMSLSYATAIGRSRIEAAATVVDRNARTPIKSRPGLEKLTGEVAPIKTMYKMEESDHRDYLTFQKMDVSQTDKITQILELIWGDTKKVKDGLFKKIDLMCLEAVSTGQITITPTNNPDGIVAADPISLLMPDDNIRNVAVSWDTPNTSTPITDISNAVDYAQPKGITFAKILMTRPRFLKMAQSTETRNLVAGMLRVAAKEMVMPTLQVINEYLEANLFPVIELVNETIGIEEDGIIKTVKPWKEENVTLIPAGYLGKIHNAVAIEQLHPVSGVTYATANNALISKWSENEPFGEFTKGEINAFPGLEAIDSIVILKTTTTS